MKRRSDVSDVERFLSRHERVKTDGMYTSGELFDCWRITAFLGRGGSGEVYRVVNVVTGEAAALKTALTPELRHAERIAREANFLSENHCVFFPQFFCKGIRDGVPYFVMELLEEGEIPHKDKEVAQFLFAIGEAVAALHRRGFVHRDIKPSNIMYRVSREASRGVATDQKVTLANAFEIADDVLLQAVTSISGLIKNTGFINLDFADVTCIMKNAGFAHMGVGHAAGKGKAEEAARMAVASPLMETSINGARGVLINITGSEDMDLDDVETAANLVQEAAHPEANIIFGASFDDSLEDEIRVTVIATGFEDNSVPAAAPAAPAANPFTPVRPAAAPAAPVAPAARPQGLFSGAAEKAAAAAPAAPVLPVAPAAEKAAAAAPAEEDPFDSIFKIFNTK